VITGIIVLFSIGLVVASGFLLDEILDQFERNGDIYLTALAVVVGVLGFGVSFFVWIYLLAHA
jgi:hypothetical protein